MAHVSDSLTARWSILSSRCRWLWPRWVNECETSGRTLQDMSLSAPASVRGLFRYPGTQIQVSRLEYLWGPLISVEWDGVRPVRVDQFGSSVRRSGRAGAESEAEVSLDALGQEGWGDGFTRKLLTACHELKLHSTSMYFSVFIFVVELLWAFFLLFLWMKTSCCHGHQRKVLWGQSGVWHASNTGAAWDRLEKHLPELESRFQLKGTLV